MPNKERWATGREAAEFYQVTRQRIHQLIKEDVMGETTTIPFGSKRLWLIRYPFQWKAKTAGRPRKENIHGQL